MHKRSAMLVSTLIVCVALGGGAKAQPVIRMDAAELDGLGAELTNEQGYLAPAFRLIVDNTLGTVALDSPKFTIDRSTTGGWGGWLWDDPDNPWYGARGGADVFMHDGKKYTVATALTGYYPDDYWTFEFHVDPTPANPDDIWNDRWVSEVPIGIRLDTVIRLSNRGEDVRLFASPSQGEFTANDETTTLYDYDRGPQTIPEPATACILMMGLGLMGRRRWRRLCRLP